MHYPQKAENRFTPAEQEIFDRMVQAVRVKHESWKTGQTTGTVSPLDTLPGQVVDFPSLPNSAIRVQQPA